MAYKQFSIHGDVSLKKDTMRNVANQKTNSFLSFFIYLKLSIYLTTLFASRCAFAGVEVTKMFLYNF